LNSKQLEWRIFFIEIRILFLFRNRLTRKQKKHRRKFMQECDVWDVPDVRGVEDFWEYFLGLWDDDTDSDETDQDEIDLNEPFIEELPEWNLVDDFWMHPPPLRTTRMRTTRMRTTRMILTSMSRSSRSYPGGICGMTSSDGIHMSSMGRLSTSSSPI
jgi:hypothetical protein